MREYITGSLAELGYSKEAIEHKFNSLLDKAEKTGDLSNANRSLENIAKIQGLFTDKTNNNIALFNLSNEDSNALRDKLHNKEVLSINSIETVEDKADSTAVDSVDDTTDEHSTEQGTESQVIDTNDDMVIEGRE